KRTSALTPSAARWARRASGSGGSSRRPKTRYQRGMGVRGQGSAAAAGVLAFLAGAGGGEGLAGDVGGGFAPGPGLGVCAVAVAEDGEGGAVDVLLGDGGSAVHGGERLGGLGEVDDGAGAGAVVNELADEVGGGGVGGSGGADEADDVVADGLADGDGVDE